MRAVLDVNVIISALLAPHGSPARVLRRWIEGAFALVVSPLLLAELERALGYPKLRDRITEDEADTLIELLRREAQLVDDPPGPPDVASPDPDDEYVIALAAATRSVIVSGDRHLLGLADSIPVYTPAEFLETFDEG